MAKDSLRSVMSSVNQLHSGHSCQTCDALKALNGDDRVALVEWLRDKSISVRMINEALKLYGWTVSKSSISRHRREHSVE